MLRGLGYRYLARQFARPRGLAGRWIFGAWLDRVNREMNRLALPLLDVQPGDSVLEVGFGGGNLLAAILSAAPRQAIGAELSQEMVARGQRRFADEIQRGKLRLFRASVERLPLETASIDKAASLHSIYFWPDAGAGLRELARVVRPGGFVVIGIEAPETLRAWPGHSFGFTVYDPAELIGLAAAAGFGDAEVHEGVEPRFGKIYSVKVKRL